MHQTHFGPVIRSCLLSAVERNQDIRLSFSRIPILRASLRLSWNAAARILTYHVPTSTCPCARPDNYHLFVSLFNDALFVSFNVDFSKELYHHLDRGEFYFAARTTMKKFRHSMTWFDQIIQVRENMDISGMNLLEVRHTRRKRREWWSGIPLYFVNDNHN